MFSLVCVVSSEDHMTAQSRLVGDSSSTSDIWLICEWCGCAVMDWLFHVRTIYFQRTSLKYIDVHGNYYCYLFLDRCGIKEETHSTTTLMRQEFSRTEMMNAWENSIEAPQGEWEGRDMGQVRCMCELLLILYYLT